MGVFHVFKSFINGANSLKVSHILSGRDQFVSVEPMTQYN